MLAAWHVAALSRLKKLPRLEELLGSVEPAASAPQSPEVQLQMIRLHHALMGGKTVR